MNVRRQLSFAFGFLLLAGCCNVRPGSRNDSATNPPLATPVDLRPIRVGELLEIGFPGMPGVPPHEEKVKTDGCITFPLLGDFPVAGLTLSEAQDKITDEIRKGSGSLRPHGFAIELKRR